MMVLSQLLRVKQWTKNSFVVLPFIISLKFLDFLPLDFIKVFVATICFCFTSSSVYIINDLHDVVEDNLHPRKRLRPIASKKVSKGSAISIAIILLTASIFLTVKWFNISSLAALLSYFVLNLLYTIKLKHYALFDCFLISIFFIIRILFGLFCLDITISKWILLLTFSLCLFLAFSKRKSELTVDGYNRKSLDQYNSILLDKLITIGASIAICSYVMYTNEMTEMYDNYLFMVTDLFVFFGIFRYLQIIYLDKQDFGEPSRILYRDKVFSANIILWFLLLIIASIQSKY